MRTIIVLLFGITSILLSCKVVDSVKPCQEITQGQEFEARINDTWCLPEEDILITFGPIVEESRCNVTGIDCVWAGRFVLALEIDTKESAVYRDTLFAEHNWQDTIAVSSYSLILNRILPEQRNDMTVDTANYRFKMILK